MKFERLTSLLFWFTFLVAVSAVVLATLAGIHYVVNLFL